MKAKPARAMAFSVPSAARSASVSKRERRRWLHCLLFSCIGAAVCGVFGLSLSAFSLLRLVARDGTLSIVGTILLVLSFAMLAVVSHCLDRIAEFDRQVREEIYRQKLRKMLSK